MITLILKTRKGEEKPGHKYIRRVPLPAGGYKYVYKETEERSQKVVPVKKFKPQEFEVQAIDLKPSNQFEHNEKVDKAKNENTRMMKMSDNYFNASLPERARMKRTAITKMQSFVKFLRDNRLYDVQKFREFSRTSNKKILSQYFGLTNKEFSSESGDKLNRYVNVSFAKDGNYVTLNYADSFFFNSINKEMPENRKPKWSLQMRMARGITFDIQTAELVSFPYEKFFNMNEYIDGEMGNLAKKFSEQKAIASEKVDGILIQAFYDKHNDKIRFGTRARLDPDDKGFIETAEKLSKKSGHYDELKNYLKNGKSMILELIDPRYRVVVGYGKKSALFLHGVRDLRTLEMQSFDETQGLAKQLGLETPHSRFFSSFEDLVKFRQYAKEDLEGFVVRFEDGSMIKAKTKAYFDKLKGLKALTHKAIAESIMNGEDWNKFKYERIKSEELFDVADKYRADVVNTGDNLHKFITGFVDKILEETKWNKFSSDEKNAMQKEFRFAYESAVKTGIINREKVKPEDFRLAINYLASYSIKKNEKDRDAYNKKLMTLAVGSLKTSKWMGSKLAEEEIARSIEHMDLTKGFIGGISLVVSGPGQGAVTGAGIGSSSSDVGKVYKMSPEEKKKRKAQKLLED